MKYSLKRSYMSEPGNSTRLYSKLSLSVGFISLVETRSKLTHHMSDEIGLIYEVHLSDMWKEIVGEYFQSMRKGLPLRECCDILQSATS